MIKPFFIRKFRQLYEIDFWDILYELKNFGIHDLEEVSTVGANAKSDIREWSEEL